MNRLIICLITLLSLLALHGRLQAQPDTLWSRTFGGERRDELNGLITTSDGGYALCGKYGFYEEREERGLEDLYVVKTDESGEEIWSSIFGGSGRDIGWGLIETLDSGFIAVGETRAYEDSAGAWVIKTDSTGEMEWWQTYGGNGDRFDLVIPYEDLYLVIGTTSYAGAGSSDIWLVLIEEDGEEVDSWTFGDRGRDWAVSVNATFDGGFIVAGVTSAPDGDDADGILIKLDSEFETEWINTYDNGSEEGFGEVLQLSDSSYIALGNTGEYGVGGNKDIYLVKVDKNGDSLWTKTIGGEENELYCKGILTPDEDVVIASQISREVYLLRLDEEGNIIWSTIIEDGGTSKPTYIVATDDGGYAFATTTRFGLEGQYSDNLWLVKLNTDMLRLLDFPDTSMLSTETLLLRRSWFNEFVSPQVYLDSALTYEIVYDGEMDVSYEWGRLTIEPNGWSGLDSLQLIILEADNEENGDTATIRIDVIDPDAVNDLDPNFNHPSKFGFVEVHPNPFNGSVAINFNLPVGGDVNLTVFNIKGRQIMQLVDGYSEAGEYSRSWDAVNMSSGIYIVRLKTAVSTDMIKMSLIR